uniref:GATA zinc finger domain-containing protein 4-like n=2 Tax=Dermatophagoides pteronyssinus TaxID=6956 RepID=A0A6P6XS82_DERPT|nr:GATA zinc finger domain-containing protein 4-like [Dermatophagoides pteronyssinus]
MSLLLYIKINSKFPNVQSYTEQDLYNYSNYSLTSIQSKQQQQNYSYDLNYTKNRSSSNSGEHQKQQQQQQEIADTVEEPDYFQDMVPEFKKPKTVYVNKHDHPMISSDNNQQNNYDNNDELNNKIEKKFRFKQQQQNQQQQDSSYQFNNNNNIDNDLLSNEPNFTNQFGTIQLSSSSTSMDMNTNQITSWEDMANNDEELWIDTDQQLKTMRQQRREQRLNEHRRQKQLKHKNG